MAPYEVVYDRKAVRDARRLSSDIRQRIREKIAWLAANFDSLRPEALEDPRFEGMLKLRVGDYRALYTADCDKRELTVHLVGHQREIYE
jgi:mRNA-degrading endonuclease RelE of RelBE toxin-antitoxin system